MAAVVVPLKRYTEQCSSGEGRLTQQLKLRDGKWEKNQTAPAPVCMQQQRLVNATAHLHCVPNIPLVQLAGQVKQVANRAPVDGHNHVACIRGARRVSAGVLPRRQPHRAAESLEAGIAGRHWPHSTRTAQQQGLSRTAQQQGLSHISHAQFLSISLAQPACLS